MSGMQWLSSVSFWLFWIIIIVLPLLIYSFIKNEKARKVFLGTDTSFSVRGMLRIFLLSAAAVLIVFSLARPVTTNKRTSRETIGQDTLFVFDVSRSMMAEDIKPNRLSQSIIAIADGMNVLQRNRLGIMAYAGTAVMLCPLTRDYSFFMDTLSGLNIDSVNRGGSMTGDAFRKIEDDILKKYPGRSLEIILITDGDDQDSFPLEAASTFRDYDVSLLIIAIGNDKTGARIPVTDEYGNKRYLMYQGQEIWSVMNTEILSGIADNVPGSALVKVNEGTLDFASIYKGFRKATTGKSTSVFSVSRQEMFQFFLLPAFALLILYLFLDLLFMRKK